MSAIPSLNAVAAPSLDLGVEIASREVAQLVALLEATLTPVQRTQLHQIRLAAESLGAVRASRLHQRPSN